MRKILPVVLSGGSGTRLWPASRSMYPKQLLPLVDGKSTLLQQTVQRLEGMRSASETCQVICNEAHRFLVAEQLRNINQQSQILLEPEGRNTAPAVALAAFLATADGDNPLLLVMAADHVIQDVVGFQRAVERGRSVAEQGSLVTFGIVPQYPETGYGYLLAEPDGEQPVPVQSFVEKPNLETAQHYVDGGRHFWNSGMFLFGAAEYLSTLQKFAPGIYEACKASMENHTTTEFVRPEKESFLACPKDSIDYAVMEKTDAAMMVPLDVGWSDVGSWSALHDVRPKDDLGNTVDGDVVLHDCNGVFVQAESRLVAVIGLNDVVVVETKDSTLVVPKDRAQDVKHIVDRLGDDTREEVKLHRQVFRPWGSYDSLENADGFQVKQLIVNPGAVLSLQKHAHRAEHWVVVKGKARITKTTMYLTSASTSPLTLPLAMSTGSPIRLTNRRTLSKCNAAIIWARTILFDWKTITGVKAPRHDTDDYLL